MMSCLENIPLLPFLDIIKHLSHEEKINLRTTSNRMFNRITEHSFKHWSFDLSNKAARIPDFVTNSDKDLHVHIKEVGFNNIQRIIKFIKTYAHRITFVKVYFSIDSCDPTNNLLKRLAALEPEWTGLTKFEVIKQSHGYVMMDIKRLFSKCSSSLQELHLAGVVTRIKEQVKLPELTVLKLSSCHETGELYRMLATQLQILHLNDEYNPEVIFCNLRELKVTFNYETNGAENIDHLICQILRGSSQTLEHLQLKYLPCQLIHLLNGIDFDFPNLKNIYLYKAEPCMNGRSIGHFMNRCAASLEILHMDDVLIDMSKLIQTEVWPQLKELTLKDAFDVDPDFTMDGLLDFLQRTPKLEILYIADDDIEEENTRVNFEGNLANLPLKSLTMLNCPLRSLGIILKSCSKTLITLSIDFFEADDHILRLSMYDLEFPRLDKVAFVSNHCQEEELIEEVYLTVRRYTEDDYGMGYEHENLVRRVRSVLFQQICGFL